MLTKKVPKSSSIYECKKCAYKTVRESQFERHLLTVKYKSLQILQKKFQKVPKIIFSVIFVINIINHEWDYGVIKRNVSL